VGFRPDVHHSKVSYGTARHPHHAAKENQLGRSELIRDRRLLPTPNFLITGNPDAAVSHHNFTGRDLISVDEINATGLRCYLELLSHLPASVQYLLP